MSNSELIASASLFIAAIITEIGHQLLDNDHYQILSAIFVTGSLIIGTRNRERE